MISIIAAIGQNNELGIDNHLVWDIPNDLKFFKKMTINHTIVMGRRTFESIGRPLPNRYNIVISSKEDNTSGVEIVNNNEEIIKRFKNIDEDIFIIGGASLYRYFIDYADKIYLTEIEDTKKADTFFPKFNKDLYEKSIIDEMEENNVKYSHVLYRKKAK